MDLNRCLSNTIPAEEEKNDEMMDVDVPMAFLQTNFHYNHCESHERANELESVEYQQDIYRYLRQIEVKNRPKADYMKRQLELTYAMRKTLIDWLCGVCESVLMSTETFYLCVGYCDRFLSCMSTMKSKYQLLGAAALFIAMKVEEVDLEYTDAFVRLTDHAYTQRQLLRTEALVLRVLQFNLTMPSPLTFIKLMCVLNKIQSKKTMHLAMFISELALHEPSYLRYLPSIIAASAIAVAKYTLGEEIWPQSFQDVTGYDLTDLGRCIIFLHKTHRKSPGCKLLKVHQKYHKMMYSMVAEVLPKNINIFQEGYDEVDYHEERVACVSSSL